MKCKKPFVRGLLQFGCGQCLACRINRRRKWSTRIILEWITAGLGCFITLTYDDEHLPEGKNLCKKDLQLFNRRLERAIGKFRYFECGEYGEQTNRPHYHLIIFKHFVASKLVKEIWGKGRVQVGELNNYTAQYVAGYVNKKLTQEKDKLLFGKKPEFALMSRRPGIGYFAVEEIKRVINKNFLDNVQKSGDVINEIRIGGSKYPLDRYLKGKLRKEVGIDGNEYKDKRLYKMSERCIQEKIKLREKARKSGRSEEKIAFEDRLQQVVRLEKRQKIFSRRNKI